MTLLGLQYNRLSTYKRHLALCPLESLIRKVTGKLRCPLGGQSWRPFAFKFNGFMTIKYPGVQYANGLPRRYRKRFLTFWNPICGRRPMPKSDSHWTLPGSSVSIYRGRHFNTAVRCINFLVGIQIFFMRGGTNRFFKSKYVTGML